jgi:hypothetical protein
LSFESTVELLALKDIRAPADAQEPTGEPEESLADTIYACKMAPALLKMGEVSVVFLLCRVGDCTTAEAFLQKIEDNKNLKGMVYCSRERIDK